MGAKCNPNCTCGAVKVPVKVRQPDPNLAIVAKNCKLDGDVVGGLVMSGVFIVIGMLGLCEEGVEFGPFLNGIFFMIMAMAVFLMMHHRLSNNKKRFRQMLSELPLAQLKVELEAHPEWLESIPHHEAHIGRMLTGLSFDQLKVELEARPQWLEFVPDPTEEMALIAIAADPTTEKYIGGDRSLTFLLDMIKINPVAAAARLKRCSMNIGCCRVWHEILKADPSVFIRDAPKRFPHLEYAIYIDLVRLDHKHIHRVPTIDLQNRIREELNIV